MNEKVNVKQILPNCCSFHMGSGGGVGSTLLVTSGATHWVEHGVAEGSLWSIDSTRDEPSWGRGLAVF